MLFRRRQDRISNRSLFKLNLKDYSNPAQTQISEIDRGRFVKKKNKKKNNIPENRSTNRSVGEPFVGTGVTNALLNASRSTLLPAPPLRTTLFVLSFRLNPPFPPLCRTELLFFNVPLRDTEPGIRYASLALDGDRR